MDTQKLRLALKIFGFSFVFAFLFLLFYSKPQIDNRARLGEEVYASHDCTDCHTDAIKLREKRTKKEVSLVRMRRNIKELTEFLEHDTRHNSYLLMGNEDRTNLVEYLKTLIVQ